MYLASLFTGLTLLSFVCSTRHDPDVDLTPPQIIRRHGYPAESHTVETADGYLLTLHRIPFGKRDNMPPRRQRLRVAFLQHGMLASSSDWILAGPDKSLAFLLADNGYDVWMGNARGNTYSRAHATLSSADSKFWNFTWHDMAMYDLPAEIDYVLQETGQEKLFYMGHSMGTTMFFVMASSLPEYDSKIRAMFALAPVAYMQYIKSPIRFFAPWAQDIEFLAHYLGADAFLPQNIILRYLAKYGCEKAGFEEEICANVVFVICGFDRPQFNMTLLPVVLSHTPAGTSTKTLVHYAQEIKSGKFQQFDYGSSGNVLKYNSSTPPQYNISAITAPILLHYADNDWLASITDVERLYAEITNCHGKYLVPLKGFNHLDFLWGVSAKSLVYDLLLKQLKKY